MKLTALVEVQSKSAKTTKTEKGEERKLLTNTKRLNQLTKGIGEFMRHYVAMCRDELGDEFRVNSVEYEYPDFDDDDELQCSLFEAWETRLANELQKSVNSECGCVWIERVSREAYKFNGFGEMF